MNRKEKINWIVKVSIFAAMSSVLYCLRFPLPFFPSFLDVQFSNLPAIIAGFASGPVAGCVIIVVKTILKLFISGSSTSYVGELADLIIGIL
jgi:riboflavin transporter FmnP